MLERYGVELIGADIDAIQRGENRELFKQIVDKVGAESARSAICHSLDECLAAVDDLGYPVVVRPSFTMGGAGSGMAYDEEDLRRIAGSGLAASPTTEVLLEESILGWKEFELNSCATATTTSWWSARSRTSIRSVFIPVTRSRLRLLSRSQTASTSGCVMSGSP